MVPEARLSYLIIILAWYETAKISKTPSKPKTPKKEIDPLEKSKKAAQDFITAALGKIVSKSVLTEIARVDRQKWLEVPLERLQELKIAASEQKTRNAKTELIHLLDNEIMPLGNLSRASPQTLSTNCDDNEARIDADRAYRSALVAARRAEEAKNALAN